MIGLYIVYLHHQLIIIFLNLEVLQLIEIPVSDDLYTSSFMKLKLGSLPDIEQDKLLRGEGPMNKTS